MTPSYEEPRKLLAIVIISRNESKNIGNCITSALLVKQQLPDTQIILVDSASTDETCSIAQRFPIEIVQLKPAWKLTPAAGRYIGTLRTDSEFVLYLDGDMVLNEEWFLEGIRFLESNHEAAGISGDMDEIYYNDEREVVGTLKNRYQTTSLREEKSFGGVGLYRRRALDKVGTFSPFVPLREEAELALRLRQAGFKLFRLPGLIATHHSAPRDTFKEIARRYQAGFYTGFGRAIYYSIKNGVGLQFLDEQGRDYIIFALFLLFCAFCILTSIIFKVWVPIFLGGLLTVLIFILFALKKGGFKNALLGFLARLLMVYGAVIGILSAMQDPDEYPEDVIVIQS